MNLTAGEKRPAGELPRGGGAGVGIVRSGVGGGDVDPIPAGKPVARRGRERERGVDQRHPA